MSSPHAFNGSYSGRELAHLGFPIGGLGAGNFCLEGNGALSRFSLRHRPHLFNAPQLFAAISIVNLAGTGSRVARVIEGPVPDWKPFFPWNNHWASSGMGAGTHSFGLPRFETAQFEARFPFGKVRLSDPAVPLSASITGWSPFVPGDPDASGLPVGAVDYHFENTGKEVQDAVFSFHSRNFMALGEEAASVTRTKGGFVLRQGLLPEKPEAVGNFAAWVLDPEAKVDAKWFRGGWFDAMTMVWKAVAEGRTIENAEAAEGRPSPGGSIYVPFRLEPGEKRTISLLVAWHVPYCTLRFGEKMEKPNPMKDCYRPWYGEHFAGIEEVIAHWNERQPALRAATSKFSECFYDSTLPQEVIEAVSANLTILKSPTVLRQHDGKLWAWEGCQDENGSCHGTCTHVWNYAQAIPHLFPSLERTLRETEFNYSQDERGHQNFRSVLPIAPAEHGFHAAADGQLGGIVKVYRDWRISGDTDWLRGLWPKVRQSLEYCIETWDPDRRGALVEPHHNTYDIEFWGPDGMCTSFYLSALEASVAMGEALGEETADYSSLLERGKSMLESELFNGEYFEQRVERTGLRARDPVEAANVGINMNYSEEAKALLAKQGPKYQYGQGCLSDGVLGEWMGWAAGLPPVLDLRKVESHLLSVHRHNYREDLATFANPQRPAYALGHEPGLVLCTWPRGGELSLPFPYSNEVWTGIEYQVAAHLISLGHVEEGLQIVRAARSRYSGFLRNPFDELECGHWYARALASYSLLQALSGVRYDAIDQVLYVRPAMGGDFRSFLSTATGYGTVGVRDGKAFLEVRYGKIDVKRIDYVACGEKTSKA